MGPFFYPGLFMTFLDLKALHIIFVVTWFAGLFYIVRLFIYHTEAQEKPVVEKDILSNQFKIMERRLWYGITWPSAVLTLVFGSSLLSQFMPMKHHPWLHAKLAFVVLLFLYHISCGIIFKKLQRNVFKYSSNQLRMWNEVATLLLFVIVFLVELKNVMSMGKAVALVVIISVLLMLGIKGYRKLRSPS